jgi:voltage-gated potassium channel
MTTDRIREEAKSLTLVHVGLALLSLYGLAALAAYYLLNLPEPTRELLDTYDDVICCLFILDFFVRLWRAKDKLGFLKWGWIDLVASIPQVNVLRVGRLLYILWVVRRMAAYRSPRALFDHLYHNRARSVFASAFLLAVLLAGLCAILILEAESLHPTANIHTPGDAVWWAWVTVCTVGYGDKFPVSPWGRLIAGVLMTAGITLFGTLAGLLSSYFLRAILKGEEREVERLRKEVHLLRKRIEELGGALPGHDEHPPRP